MRLSKNYGNEMFPTIALITLKKREIMLLRDMTLWGDRNV
jgi:hypothetical protein